MDFIYLLIATSICVDPAAPQCQQDPIAAAMEEGLIGPQSVKRITTEGYFKTEAGCSAELLKQSAIQETVAAHFAAGRFKPPWSTPQFECKLQKLGP